VPGSAQAHAVSPNPLYDMSLLDVFEFELFGP
jgi:hypothetical protein